MRRSSSFPATRRSLPFCPRPRGPSRRAPGASRFPWFVPHRTNHPLAMGAVLRWNGSRPSSVGPPVTPCPRCTTIARRTPRRRGTPRASPCGSGWPALSGPRGATIRTPGTLGHLAIVRCAAPTISIPRAIPRPTELKTTRPPGRYARGDLVNRNPGGDLLSQGASPQVPSARAGLTAVFGMGTGVSPPPWPPETVRSAGRPTPAGTAAHLRAASPQTLSVPKRARAK